jgi:hypothetical protein
MAYLFLVRRLASAMRLTLLTYRLLGFVPLVLLLAFPVSLRARLMEAATYQEMFDKADLVVIAKSVRTKDTSERTTLPGWDSIHVVGVNTQFETELVLKGDKDVKNFVLHHYRIDEVAEPLPIISGPTLASFDPKEHNKYLLFLIKQPDGKYAPASGQVDPATFSIIKLPSIP